MTHQRAEELEISSFDGVLLKGVLSISPGDKALLVTVHGSFLQTRDGDLDGKKRWMFPQGAPKRHLFVDVANTLSDIGIGCFRYDKRASGGSGGIYEDTDINHLVKDLIAVVTHLKKRFLKIKMGVLGQSEGTLTAMRAYQLGLRPDFMILQGPVLEPLEAIFDFQKSRAAAPFLKNTDGEMEKRFPYLTAFYNAYYHGDLLDKIKNTKEPQYILKIGNWSAATNIEKFRQYNWDGSKLLEEVKCPVALIVGSEDANVPATSVLRIEKLKTNGLYQNVCTYVFQGLEHSFRKISPGESFFDAMEKPVSPDYLKILKDFCRKQL